MQGKQLNEYFSKSHVLREIKKNLMLVLQILVFRTCIAQVLSYNELRNEISHLI